MMKTNSREKIQQAFTRKAKALQRMPSIGRNTAVTNVLIREGLTCEVSEGKWRFKIDSSPQSGGNDQGPNPGTFGRAALGSCLAMTYMNWAVQKDIPINALEVEVQADYDANPYYGLADDVPPGYAEVRYIVKVESSASEAEIQNLLDYADSRTPYLDIFARAQKVKRVIQYNPINK